MREHLASAVILADNAALVLKAAGVPELATLAAHEIALGNDLLAAHKKAATDAIRAGVGALGTSDRPATEKEVARVIETIEGTYNEGFTPAATVLMGREVPVFYRLARNVAWKKATGQVRARLLVEVKKAGEEKIPAHVLPVFDLVDEKAVKALVNHQIFWIGDVYHDLFSDGIATTARETMIESGLGRREAGKLLAEKLGKESFFETMPPTGWKGNARDYYKMVAGNAATTARATGSVHSFEKLGVSRIIFYAVGDERTCNRCGLLDGKVFPISAAGNQVKAMLAARSPTGIRGAHPWHTESFFDSLGISPGKGTAGEIEVLIAARITMPPLHGACRCNLDVAPG